MEFLDARKGQYFTAIEIMALIPNSPNIQSVSAACRKVARREEYTMILVKNKNHVTIAYGCMEEKK